MALNPGDRLGAHEIIGLLGAGGMGEVYRAQDTKLNRQVAIKVLHDSHVGEPERLARFQREAQAVAALNHPNIAAIFEFDDSGDTRFLVLELVEGDTLADRIRRGPVPVVEALGIARQILEALESAHERGICHRDLKPANIKLVGGTGGTTGLRSGSALDPPAVKVLDFGLAKFLQSGPAAPHLTHSPTLSLAASFPGMILGTAGYMSPEQANGYEADERSDIFSFGCVFYELLTGRQAFEGNTASEILASVLKIEADFTALPPNLNPRIVEILRRCLEKNPKKRWHSAADVRVELEAVMGRALVVNEPGVTVESARRPLWKRAVPVAAGVLVGTLAAGYAAWTLRPAPAAAVTRFTVELPDDQRFTNTGRQVVALSPDGAHLVYVANNRLFLRSMSGLDARVIAGSEVEAGLLNPVFSPDGQSLAFYSNGDRTLKRLALGGGAAVTICQADGPFGMSWGEDGLVFGQRGKGILRVSPNGGVPEVIAAVGADQSVSSPQVLPGGRAVLFTVKKGSDIWDKGQVVAQPLDGGERKVLIDGGADGRYLPTGHLVYAISGMLLAVPFDARSLTVSGGPVPVVEGVRRAGTSPAATATAQFSYAQNGSLAYLPGPVSTSEQGVDLAIFDRTGMAQPLKLPPGPYRSPRVSPDGKSITFDSEDESDAIVWVYDLDGTSAIRRLTFGGKNRAPIWSADGSWIAYQSDREGDLAIFRQRADGSGAAERLTKPDKGAIHTPESWSPDGEHLLFSVRSGEQPLTLWTMTLKDKRAAAFGDVQSPANLEAAFSPDGRWIAYYSRASGSNHVYVQPFPATGAKYEIPQIGGAPFWSGRGDELIFNTAPNLSVAVAFTAAPRVSFGRPVEFQRRNFEGNPLSSRRNADALPDGKRYVGVVSVAQSAAALASPQITIVLNWFDEVRQRVPGN